MGEEKAVEKTVTFINNGRNPLVMRNHKNEKVRVERGAPVRVLAEHAAKWSKHPGMVDASKYVDPSAADMAMKKEIVDLKKSKEALEAKVAEMTEALKKKK